MGSQSKRFAFFNEAATPAGAEGWQEMYPYHLVPQPEGQASENERFWFADSMHWSRAVHPFDSIGAEAVYYGVGINSARAMAFPSALGLDLRIINGTPYICPTPVTDPDEIRRRHELFSQRAGHYYQHWDDIYARWKEKMLVVIERMRSLAFNPLPAFEPSEVVLEARGRSVSWDLVENYHQLINDFFLAWQYHFEMLGLGYGAYMVFFERCKTAFPEIDDQTIARMVAGVEGITFRPDDELRRLAKLAVQCGVTAAVCAEGSAQAVLEGVRSVPGGTEWLAAFEAARDPWFNYFSEYGFLHDQDTWNRNLSIPLKGIARYIDLLKDGQDIDRDVARLLAERDELAGEYLSLLSPEEAREFEEALRLARAVFPYIEEHNIYVEHWSHAAFWDKVRELASVFVAAGFFEDESDLYHLNRFEVDQALADLVQSWAIGVPARGVAHWRAKIRQRRVIMGALRASTPPPAYGIPPTEVTDPFAIMNYGVTTERVADWLNQANGTSAEIAGIPASPGLVEGTVRVLRHENELGTLQPGDVLVAAITAPSWASAFSVVSAVVTDIGGMMCHAAIVCREYGMPAVVSTGFATTRLKTGQRVRVDGRKGTVTVLSSNEEVTC